MMAPIRAESTPAIIARQLRDAIERGYFGAGQQMLEAQLAKQFEVSRGAVREAMQRLTQEGLLISRPNRGLFVAEFGRDEVFDIYTARLAIERAACLKVIEVLGTHDEVATVLDALSDQLEQRAAEGAEIDDLLWLDIEFHERMVAAADSPRLSRMYATLATETRMCLMSFEKSLYSVSDRIAAHREIAAVIRARGAPRRAQATTCLRPAAPTCSSVRPARSTLSDAAITSTPTPLR